MKGKVALITGGAAGIGRKTAETLAEAGCNLAVTYRSSETMAKQLAGEISSKYGADVIAIQGDAASEEDCRRITQEVKERFGRVDIFIHNAGPYVHERRDMVSYTSDEWRYIIDGNLNGFFYFAKDIIPMMREQGFGRIITLGFDRTETAPGWIYRSAFAAAKTALTSLTKTVAMEEAGNGITANMVYPGDITGDWKEKGIAEAKMHTDSTVPAGRPGTGEDLARVIRFLCDEQSDFITGSVIPVTGGKDVLAKVYTEDKHS